MRYDSYKDSGEQWLGQIPSHWEMKRLEASFALRREKYSPAETLGILSLLKDVGIVPYEDKGNIGNTAKTDVTQYKVARKGDLVINSMNVIIGSLGITPLDGYISPAYYAFIPRGKVCTPYFNYILSLRRAQQNIRRFASGIMEIRLKISAKDFLSINYPLPPLKEQERMVAYLDEQTAKIDAAIAQQQKMIDLLNERKQIIIQNAVTKGLDPNAKMKDSGIDWIGEIPEGWKIVKLSHLVSKVGSGSTPRGGADVYPEVGITFIRSQNVYNEGFRLDDVVFISNKTHLKMRGTHVLPNDILYNITGGSIGRCYYVENNFGEANINQHVSIIRPTKISSKYLMFYLQSHSGQNQLRLGITGGNREGLSAGAMKNFDIPVPRDNEQAQIVDYIEQFVKRIENARRTYNQSITLLQERKQIIINEVVTGKIKV